MGMASQRCVAHCIVSADFSGSLSSRSQSDRLTFTSTPWMASEPSRMLLSQVSTATKSIVRPPNPALVRTCSAQM